MLYNTTVNYLKDYNLWLDYSYKICMNYGRKFPEQYFNDFCECSSYAVLKGLRKYYTEGKGTKKTNIFFSTLQECTKIAKQILMVSPGWSKHQLSKGLHTYCVLTVDPEDFKNVNIYYDNWQDFLNADEVDWIGKHYDRLDLDSVLFKWQEFKKLHKNITEKQHDNLRLRTIKSIKKLYKTGVKIDHYNQRTIKR